MLSVTAASTTGAFVVAVVTSAAAFSATGAVSCASAFGLTILFSDIVKSRWFYFGAAKVREICKKRGVCSILLTLRVFCSQLLSLVASVVVSLTSTFFAFRIIINNKHKFL